jgi:hypothetical protein
MQRRYGTPATFWKLGTAALAVAFTPKARGDISATWDVSTGNWSTAANWSSNPNYPNNGTPPGALYDVFINSGTATLDVSPTIQTLNMSAGTITGNNSLTLDGLLTWNGGALSGVTATASDGITVGKSSVFVTTGTLVNAPGQTMTMGASGASDLSLSETATLVNAGILNATGGGIFDDFGVENTFYNSGTFNSKGTTTSTMSIAEGLDFNNTGSIDVQAGTLFNRGDIRWRTSGISFNLLRRARRHDHRLFWRHAHIDGQFHPAGGNYQRRLFDFLQWDQHHWTNHRKRVPDHQQRNGIS